MDAQLILQEFDKLLEAHEIQQAEEYLVQSMEEASSLQELDTLLILTNEAMGFYRESGQNIKSIDLHNHRVLFVNGDVEDFSRNNNKRMREYLNRYNYQIEKLTKQEIEDNYI